MADYERLRGRHLTAPEMLTFITGIFNPTCGFDIQRALKVFIGQKDDPIKESRDPPHRLFILRLPCRTFAFHWGLGPAGMSWSRAEHHSADYALNSCQE